MDAHKFLPIKRHTTLLTRLPETRFSSPLSKSKANWIVFGEYLSPQYFDDIDFFTGFYNTILDTWKVGQYEVALMSGNLTPAHEEILQALKLDYDYHHVIKDVYPSVFEGFGIPIIEALYSKIPVITTAGGCFPEAGGEHSLYVDTNNFELLGDTIDNLLGDNIQNELMAKKGLEYAQRFNPKLLTEQLVSVYNKVK